MEGYQGSGGVRKIDTQNNTPGVESPILLKNPGTVATLKKL